MALIKCPECEKKISDKANACPNCGYPVNRYLVERSEKLQETIILNGLCNRVKGLFVQNGKGMLTNHRFIYLKHSIGEILAFGALVNLKEGSYEFDIPLEDIEAIEEGRHGVSKILVIYTKNGEKYKFYLSHLEKWKNAFNNLLSDTTDT